MAEPIGTRPADWRRFAGWCAIAAVPIAFATASIGHGLTLADPWRDGATLVLASVAEEIVFRGGLQPLLSRSSPLRTTRFTISGANVVTSVLFAAFHLWRHPFAVAASIFPVSLALGRVREESGRIWPAALLHVAFNALLCAATLLVSASR